MRQPDDSMPRPPVIRAALRKTTLALAREIAAPGTPTPDWDDFEWRVAMAASAMHGTSALLHSRSRWQGPVVWQAFLADQKRQTLLRQQRITGLLAQLDQAGRAQGIPMLAMKGSALLALGLYADGERPMSDIDLLVHPRNRDRTLRLLQAMGYVAELDTARHVCLRPAGWPSAVAFGEHADNAVKIELHTRVYEQLPIHEVDITALQLPEDTANGINAYPSIAALMRNLLLHTAGNLRAGACDSFNCHDIARLAARLDSPQWAQLLRQEADAPALWWALPPLRLASRHFPDAIPASVIRRVERSSRPLLRWSSRRRPPVDASLSCEGIPALPGLAWSASFAEATALIVNRLVPRRELQAIRAYEATQVALAGSSWTHASQVARISRWILHRPVPAATMYSIRQALAYRPVDAAWSASNKAAV